MNFVSVPLRIHAHTRCHKMLITYIYESSRPIRVCRSTQVVIFDWKTISSVNKYIVGAFGVSHLKLRGIRIMCAPIYARVFFLFVFCANPVCQRLSHSEMGTGQKNVLFIQWMCRRLSSFFFLLSCGISVIDGVVGVTFRWLLIISCRRFFLFVRAQVFRCYYLLYVACGRVAKQLIFDPISAQQVEMCADLMTTMTPKTKKKKRNEQTANQTRLNEIRSNEKKDRKEKEIHTTILSDDDDETFRSFFFIRQRRHRRKTTTTTTTEQSYHIV